MLDPFMTGNVPGFIKRQNNVDKRPFLTIFTTFEIKFTVLHVKKEFKLEK